MARRLLAVTLLCLSEAASALLLSRPTLRHAARCSRAVDVRCGFEVETLKGKDVEDMNILNWPTLEKRLEDFEKSAELDEMMYVYCREGSASLSAEGEEDTTISAGARDRQRSALASPALTVARPRCFVLQGSWSS